MSQVKDKLKWYGMPSLLLLAMASHAVAKPGGRPGTQGKYNLVFHGSFRGNGSAKINPAHLTINAELAGPTGGGTLDVPKLKIEDGRFEGTGTLGSESVEVTGRVDAPEGGLVKVARLIITVRTKDGRVARAFADRSE